MSSNTDMKECLFEAELCFVMTTNNPNVVLCKGKPKNIDDDVQYYYFQCECQNVIHAQPSFEKFVKDGLIIMCSTCAKKSGFNDIHHNNGSKEMLVIGKRPI